MPLVVGQPALKIRQRRLRAMMPGVIFSGCAAAWQNRLRQCG